MSGAAPKRGIAATLLLGDGRDRLLTRMAGMDSALTLYPSVPWPLALAERLAHWFGTSAYPHLDREIEHELRIWAFDHAVKLCAADVQDALILAEGLLAWAVAGSAADEIVPPGAER